VRAFIGTEWTPLLIVGIYGPTVGALLTSALRGGWRDVVQLVRRLVPWRVSVMWCLIAFAVPVVIDIVSIALYTSRGGVTGPLVAPNLLATVTYFGIKLTRGPLGEELGWRGFLLPALQTRYGALGSSLLIGTLWFAWHLPIVWMAGTWISGPSVSVYQLAWFAVSLICLAIIITWVVNHAGGSVVPAVLVHGASNAALPLLFLPELSADATRAIVYLSLIPTTGLAIAVAVIESLRADPTDPLDP